jgi:hypothetical protein
VLNSRAALRMYSQVCQPALRHTVRCNFDFAAPVFFISPANGTERILLCDASPSDVRRSAHRRQGLLQLRQAV